MHQSEIETYSLDTHLENRIGFGKYHVFLYISLGLIDFVDGSVQQIIIILLPLFRNLFNMSKTTLSIFTALSFLGAIFGLIITGFLNFHIGRKNILLISTLTYQLSILD